MFRPSASKHVEGQYRGGPWHLPISGGYLPHDVGKNWNWWQMGYDPVGGHGNAIVEACISRYAQTVAMCPGSHWRTRANGGRERVVNSALNRVLRKPNSYQSISDFLLNGTRGLYSEGNWFALALRNDRFEVDSLHLMAPRSSRVSAIGEDGSLFYHLDGNPVIDRLGIDTRFVSARDVLHVRLNSSSRDMLRGETPLMAAAVNIATSNAVVAQQLAFYINQARPSFLLGTDKILNASQVKELREAWDAQSQGMNAGKTPILTAGLKPLPVSSTANDMQLAEVLKLSDQAVAEAFGIPLQIFGIGGTPKASTEALMSDWLASGLGFALNHIEEALGNLFALKGQPEEYLEFDTAALLRSSFKERIEAYALSTKSGIHAPNEARADFELAAMPFGDEPRIQIQDVTFSQQATAHDAQLAAPPAPSPAPNEETADEDRANVENVTRFRQSFRAAHERHVS